MPTVTYTLTNAGQNMFRDASQGAASCKVTYFAMGTGTNTPTTSDTKLQQEVFRKKIASYTNGTNPGEIIFSAYVAPGDAVGVVIGEVAWFGGNANGTANTGILLARGLYSHTKTNLESIPFSLDATI